MESGIKITEDTLTTYFNKVLGTWETKEGVLLKKLGSIFTAEVDPAVDTGTLLDSGLNKRNWQIVTADEISELYITYSGAKNKKRWTEFGGDQPKSEWRDYAYFQETTEDSKAKSSDARQPHFVRNAAEFSSEKIRQKTQDEYYRILQIK